MKYFQTFASAIQETTLQLNPATMPPDVSEVGVPGMRLSMEVKNVNDVGDETPDTMYDPSKAAVLVEK